MYSRLTTRPGGRARQTPSDYYRDRQRRRQDSERAAAGAWPTLEQIADPENLYQAFMRLRREAGPAPGIDGLTYDDISRKEIGRLVRVLSPSILGGSYRPYPSRRVDIPKGNGKLRSLDLRIISDRVVASTLTDAMTWPWEKVFLPCSYGFRPQRSTWTLLANLEADAIKEDRWVMAMDDVRDAFPSVNIDQIMADHARYIAESRLLGFIDTILRGGNSSKKLGIDQGSAYSPCVLNVRLHHALDVHIAQLHPFSYRYADNIAFLCKNVPEGQKILTQSQSCLSKANLTLKGEDGVPVDLRMGVAQFLGFALAAGDRGFRIGLGKQAWDRLRQDLLRGHLATDPALHALGAVNGWIAAYGPAFGYERSFVVDSILRTCSALEFRDVIVPEDIERQMESSFQRWLIVRKEINHEELDLSVSQGMSATAPPVAIAPSHR